MIIFSYFIPQIHRHRTTIAAQDIAKEGEDISADHLGTELCPRLAMPHVLHSDDKTVG